MSALVASHVRPDGVGELRLARPAKRNALSHALVDEAVAALDRFEAAGVRVALLRAEPPVFCAGNDLVEAMADRDDPASERFLALLLERPIFWIAVLEGPALGAGISVPAVCPVALAADTVTLSLPELQIGIFPAGVLPYVEPFAGPRRSLEAGLTGAPIAAREAVALQLLTEAVPAARLEERVEAWCAIATAKPQVTDAARRSWQARLRTAPLRERADQLQAVLDAQAFDAPARGAAPSGRERA